MIPSKQLALGLTLLLIIAAFVFSINILTSPSNTTSTNDNTVTYTMRLHTLDGAPDGINRTLIGVNGGYGWDFVIRARQGQKLIVHVINDLDEPTAIHWHGIYQNRSNVYDGTSHVTQCPIPAHSELTYTVNLEQAGTYWWHSHHGPQYIDGLRGPMIIDPIHEDHLKYDEEIIVQLSDWYHRQGSDVVQAINAPTLDINRPKDIIPDSAIVNGHGRFNCSFINSSCEPGVPRAQFNVLAGKTYRVRLINTAAFAGFNVSLDGHNMTVVSVDGIDVVPTTVNHLRINVAQRYDVLIYAPESSKGNFWFRATMNNIAPLFFLVGYAGQDIYGLGIWSYENSTADPTSTVSNDLFDLDDFALVPFIKSTPPKPDASFNFTINILKDNITNVTGPHVAIDNGPAFPYRYTEKPTLFSVVANEPLPKQIHPFVVNQSSTVDITVINYNQGEHPFHMHGHSFWVLAHGIGLTLPTTDALNLLENPLQRDTVAVTACESFRGECIQPGWTIIRVRLDNPGVWLFHCHIEWDMATGMGMTLIVNPSEIQSLGIPKDIQSTCPAY
uniref:Secreted protein n=1 Tax=Thraustotheca clavata TaxID=74557 RepID=A0A0A7CLV2_9STRA|nr:secreted protein [Thraustotheca clavata]